MSRKLGMIGLALPMVCLFLGCERPLVPPVNVNANNVDIVRKALLAGVSEDAGPGAAVTATPTGWATLKGVFKLDGPPPARAILKVDKEQNICMPGGKPVLGEAMVVDPSTNGIKDVLIYLSTKTPATPEWEHPSYAETAMEPVEFDQKNCVFLSHTFAFRTSQPLKILNSDPIGHNTNIPARGGMRPTNPTVQPLSSETYIPGGESNEPTAVSCSIHPWMSANLIARNNPYFAVTNADGSFEIANIPAGVDLEFRVWQEKLGFVGKMTISGKANEDKKGIVKLKAENDATVQWDVVIPAP